MCSSAPRSHYILLHHFKAGLAELSNNMPFSSATPGHLAQYRDNKINYFLFFALSKEIEHKSSVSGQLCVILGM